MIKAIESQNPPTKPVGLSSVPQSVEGTQPEPFAEDRFIAEEKPDLLRKTGHLLLSYLPGGQYLVAQRTGRSEEEIKWFKRLEILRAAFLGLASAGAAVGDPLSIAINATAYLFTSIPANVSPPKSQKTDTSFEPGRGLCAVFSSPKLATYFAAGFLANNIAAFGGPNMMYAESSPFTNVDTITHFMGGVSFGKMLDTSYRESGVAGKLRKACESLSEKLSGDSAAGKGLKKMLNWAGSHAAQLLTVGSFAAIGPMWEATEYFGAQLFRSSSTAVAALRETSFNWIKDMIMNALGAAASYHIGREEEA
jgi:hypothetical protein